MNDRFASGWLYRCSDGYVGIVSDVLEHLNLTMKADAFRNKVIKGQDFNGTKVDAIGVRYSATKYTVRDTRKLGEVVYIGTKEQIAERFKCSEKTVQFNSTQGNLMKGRYKIEIKSRDYEDVLFDVINQKTKNKEKPKVSVYDEVYDYAVRHLNEYGNTVLVAHAKKIIAMLEDNGWDLAVTKYDGKLEGESDYYIIEVK